MPFALLYDLLPELAKAETRAMLFPGPDGIPREDVAFTEMFCNEPGCDCRRVVFRVTPTNDPNRVLANISYGWEPDSFYRTWARFPLDDDDMEELRGPGLMRLNVQSERADEMLSLCRTLLADEAYVQRVVRHYHTFRRMVDTGHNAEGSKARALFSGWRSPSGKRRKRK